MSIVLDEVTRAEYLAQTLASSRASGIVTALGSTVYCEVYDGSNVLRASGTMASPWATASGSTITVGEVTNAGIIVSSGGVPDSLWYAQFRGSNGRFVRGTFGVSTDTTADFRWNQTTFQTGSRGTLGTVTLTTTGAADGGTGGPAVAVTTFQITSTVGGSNLPWAFGHAFVQGDVPSGYNVVSDEPGFQSTVINRWGDGSVKFAIIAGRTTLTANVAKSIAIQRSTATLGTSIGLTALQALVTAGQYTVDFGTFGTCDLFSALFSNTTYTAANTGNKKWSSGLVRQWVAGPTMSEWHFYTPVPNDSHLAVFWQVRLWAGGEIEVEIVVDNGWLMVASPTQKNYAPVVTINGVTQTAIGAISHLALTRWSRSYWKGTNPQVAPAHNTTYLQSTKLVPKYGFTPSTSALAAWSTVENTTPFVQADWPIGMGNAGGNGALFEQFDAHYIATGDARAYRAVIGNARSGGRYALIQRDETTLKPIKFTSYPNLVSSGWGLENSGASTTNSYTPTPTGTSPPPFVKSHQRTIGALAYLLTGKWHFGESVQFQAQVNFLAQTDTNRSNGSGVLLATAGALQTRGAAWAIAALARAAAFTPDSEASSFDYVTSLTANLDYYGDAYTGQNPLGIIRDYTNYGAGTGSIAVAPWQHNFHTIAWGYTQDIASHLLASAKQTKLTSYRQWLAKLPIGLLGGQSTSEYCFRRASEYTINVGTTESYTNDATWNAAMRADYGAVFLATFGTANTSCASGSTLLGTSGGDPALMSSDPYCYWAIVNGAISYAVDSGASGAEAAYLRMTGASNWSSSTTTFGNTAVFAYAPRTSVGLPSWVPAAGTFANISQNTIFSVRPAGWPSVESAGPFANWSGGVFASNFGARGAYVVHGSGHLGGGQALWAGVWCFDLETRLWVGRNVPAAPLVEPATAGALGQFNSYGESTDATTVGHPYPAHTYDGLVYQPPSAGGATGNGSLLRFSLAGSPFGSPVHKFDLNSASSAPTRVVNALGGSTYPQAAHDTTRTGVWYLDYNGQTGLRFVSMSTWSITSYPSVAFNDYGDFSMTYLPPPYDCLVCTGRSGPGGTVMAVYVSRIVNDVPQAFVQVTTSGTPPNDARCGTVWSTLLNCLVGYEAAGSYRVHKLTPPGTGSTLTSGTWVWTSETLTGASGATPTISGFGNGPYSRFVEAPSLRCFIWCDSVNGAVQAWRLTGM